MNISKVLVENRMRGTHPVSAFVNGLIMTAAGPNMRSKRERPVNSCLTPPSMAASGGWLSMKRRRNMYIIVINKSYEFFYGPVCNPVDRLEALH